MKCPICKSQLDNQGYHDGISLIEDYYICKKELIYECDL